MWLAAKITPIVRVGQEMPVDAMVLSGCRICSNLTNETIQVKGGTRRPNTRNKESKSSEGKANPGGNRYGPREQSSLPQGRQRRDWTGAEVAERNRGGALH